MNKKLALRLKMIEMGIVPAVSGRDLKTMLESLPEKDQRTVKRKFRKLWRKVGRSDKRIKSMLFCEDNQIPSKGKRTARITFVNKHILKMIDEKE